MMDFYTKTDEFFSKIGGFYTKPDEFHTNMDAKITGSSTFLTVAL